MSRKVTLPEGFMQIDFQYHANRAHNLRGRLRAEAMQQLQQGKSIRETAAAFKQSRASLHRWLKWLEKPNGLDQLVGPVKGRGRRPNPEKAAAKLAKRVLSADGETQTIKRPRGRPRGRTSPRPVAYNRKQKASTSQSSQDKTTTTENSGLRSGIDSFLKLIGLR